MQHSLIRTKPSERFSLERADPNIVSLVLEKKEEEEGASMAVRSRSFSED